MTNGLSGSGLTGVVAVDTRQVALGSSGSATTLITLMNARGMEVNFLSRGGIILSMLVPDRDGLLADVVLGYADLGRYVDDKYYFGALVGRSANRIAEAAFSLGSSPYALSQNDGPHHLHGGVRGFSSYEWSVQPFVRDDVVGAVLSMESPAGDQGYPGRLTVQARYTLTNTNTLLVEYRAQTDAPTPVNLTQHTYFNLSGCSSCTILNHVLTLHASRYTPVDAALIPSGELRDVDGTAFDFRTAQRIGSRIDDNDPQLRIAGGYDHNFVIDAAAAPGRQKLVDAARLYDPSTGRVLDIRTTKPGIQVYTGNELGAVHGGKGGRYPRYAGIALETQHFPDAPNHENFPSTILYPGEEYFSESAYQFSVAADDPGT